MGVLYKSLKIYWKTIFTFTWPLVALLVFLIDVDVKFRCLYVVIVMYGYFITRCVPYGLTAFLPVVLMPLLRVVDSSKTCRAYLVNTVMMMASMFNALAIEHSGLHIRLSLCIIKKIGCSPRKIQFTLSIVTTFFSIWMANGMASKIMIPIVSKILTCMELEGIGKRNMLTRRWSSVKLGNKEAVQERPTNLTIAFYFGVAYGATAGGLNYIVGTATNLSFKGLYQTSFPGCYIESVEWLLCNIPGSILLVILINIWIQISCLGLWGRKIKLFEEHDEYDELDKIFKSQQIIENMYDNLGPIAWKEVVCGIVFLVCILFWTTSHPYFFKGWGPFVNAMYIDDSSPTMLITFILMILPATPSFLHFCDKNPSKRPKKTSLGIVTWNLFQTRVPWYKVLIFAGCASMGTAQISSGLAKYLGMQFIFLKGTNTIVLIGIVTFIFSWLTELTNNLVTCNVFIPTIIQMAVALDIHPILLSFPATLNISFSYLSPISSPTLILINEIIKVSMKDLIKVGLVPKILGWSIILIMFPTYGQIFFNKEKTPPWSYDNTTCYCPPCSNLKTGPYMPV